MTISKDSTIVITGGNGFLGSELVSRMHKNGYENIITFGSRHFDLILQEDVKRMFFQYEPKAIIHLAARVGGIGANMKNPGKFAYDNLMMGANILEEARKHNTKVVTAGTVCAYPKFTPVPFKEEDLWNGYPEETNAPYGLAKKMLLVMSQSYRQQYGSNFVFLLPVNLYGPRDSFDLETSHVIPAMIRKFHEAKKNNLDKVTLWGDGSPTREFLYVGDCADAFIQALEYYDESYPINLGSGIEISMKTLAETIKNIVSYNGSVVWDKSRPNGQPRRCLDTSKATRLLKWNASMPLSEGLKKTYEWYLQKEGETV